MDISDRPAPTVDDVALLAGVSTATVSRCLNAPNKVAKATREKVLSAVSELGYTPNFGARALAAKRTFTIGAVIPTMENAVFARGIEAFQKELSHHGYTLLIASSAYDPAQEEQQIRTLAARGVDGLLLIGYDRKTDVYDYIKRLGVPALVSWAFEQKAQIPTVGFNNHAAMYDLAAHAIGLGHRNIGIISAPQAQNDRARQRVNGVLSACKAAKADVQTDLLECNYAIDAGALAFGQLMSRDTPPTLIMCGNDVLATGAVQQARKMALSVPRDVSITGFDDIELARICDPALTTVHVPHRDMGQQAALKMLSIIDGKNKELHQELKTRLVMRDTLGPANA